MCKATIRGWESINDSVVFFRIEPDYIIDILFMEYRYLLSLLSFNFFQNSVLYLKKNINENVANLHLMVTNYMMYFRFTLLLI